MKPDIYFVIPGAVTTLTGGYIYDRQLLLGLEASGFKVAHVPLSATFPAPDAAALADAETRFAALPDGAVVLADGLAFGVLDALAQRHHQRLKIVALCHHPLALESGLSAATAEKLQQSEQRALDAATAVIVTGEQTATILTRQFAVPAAKITVAKPGTDKQDFAPCTGQPPVLLTVASLTPRKAHDVLIRALATLQHLRWQARFVGGMHFDPAWTAAIQQQIVDAGLQQRIHFTGSLADTRAEFLQADIFVLPSLFEGYGMAAAEALAFGLPVVAARAGAVPDVIPDTAGLLVPAGDDSALAEALHALLTRPALHSQLQAGARLAAAHLPNWSDTVQIVAALIRSLR